MFTETSRQPFCGFRRWRDSENTPFFGVYLYYYLTPRGNIAEVFVHVTKQTATATHSGLEDMVSIPKRRKQDSE